MGQYWIKRREGLDVQGPLASSQLRALVAEGQVTEESFVSPDNLHWHSAAKVKGLLPAAAPVPIGSMVEASTVAEASVPIVQPATPPPLPMPVLAYASPAAYAVGSVWREGNLLVTGKSVILPDLCIKCNAPAGDRRVRKTIYWHSPWVYLALLGNILIFAIVALCLRKKAVVEFGLCPAHYARRRRGIIIATVLGILGPIILIGSLIIGGNMRGNTGGPVMGIGAVVGVTTIIGAIIAGFVMAGSLRAKRIDDHRAWISGLSPEFVQNFPAADTRR